uniref:AlNc14C32G2972 protein n=1 Tax=Albugo laibachii Nc14 TaxID=890382 RepID=F0W823_9STRA|nr:AlNc14C32G2972 [Albugo laibachii Nc14]|eukprot:CCA17276.1 AlNc14C32G2972 [Albugo laibachii Nc14]
MAFVAGSLLLNEQNCPEITPQITSSCCILTANAFDQSIARAKNASSYKIIEGDEQIGSSSISNENYA